MSFLAVNLYFFGFGNMVENFSNSKENMLVTARKKMANWVECNLFIGHARTYISPKT